MDGTTQDRTAHAPGARRIGSPEGKVIGAVDPAAVEAVTAALVAAGFAADTIDVVTRDDLADADAPIDRPGVHGLISRILFSMGDELDELERMRQELADGKSLIGVPAQGDEAVHRARDVLRDQGAQGITHFGRWVITSFS